MDQHPDTQYQSGEYQPYQAPLNEAPQPTYNPEQPYYQQPQQPYAQQPYAQQPYPQQPYPPQAQQPVYPSQDIEKNNYQSEANEQIQIDHMIRRGFIIKTYGILLSQLCITLCFILISLSDSARKILTDNINLAYVLLIISAIITVVILCMFICCRSTARNSPINYILLFAFTICMSYYCFCLCAFYEPYMVLKALGLTIGATCGLTLYAFKTKTDYTYCGFFLFALIFLIPLAGLFIFLTQPTYYYVLFIVIAGIVLYSLYIIYDTQLILGELGLKYRIDDYVLAALNLYIDIIYLFIRILQLLSLLQGKN